MLTDSPPQSPKKPFKNPSVYFSIVLAVAALAVAWILYSRWQDNRVIEHRNAEEKARKQREADKVTLEQMGGKELAIQMFYAAPAAIHRGETSQLCYGVANAKTVTLEPQPNPVWPSYNRCVDVTPAKNTVYTLTIEDASGNTKIQTLEVKVH